MSEISDKWKNELRAVAKSDKIEVLSSFFKTGKGEYGEGDIFIGITVVDNRAVSKKYFSYPLSEIKIMLSSEIHEFRLAALLALVEKYRKTKVAEEKDQIVDFYFENTAYINNWDLVDLSCYKILGEYYLTHSRERLVALSDSHNFWEQRIAIVSTMAFVREKDYNTTIDLATKYLSHSHQLIHKATGWLLREIGKKDVNVLLNFLDKYHKIMPRTALRYSIERLNKEQKQKYMLK